MKNYNFSRLIANRLSIKFKPTGTASGILFKQKISNYPLNLSKLNHVENIYVIPIRGNFI